MKIPSKVDLILWGVLATCAVGLGIVVNHWRLDSGRLKVERSERKLEQQAFATRVSQLEERAAIEIENRRKADEVSNHYQKRNAELERDRAATPVRTVRLCVDRAATTVPASASSGAASGHHAAGPEGLPETPGRAVEAGIDIGPELYAIADEGDRCASQRDALQEWIRGR